MHWQNTSTNIAPGLLRACLLVLLLVGMSACATRQQSGLNARRPISLVVEELKREVRSGVYPHWRGVEEIRAMSRGREEYILVRINDSPGPEHSGIPGFRHGYRLEVEYLGKPFKLGN